MTKEEIINRLDNLYKINSNEAMVVFYTTTTAYSLHRVRNNTKEVLTKLYPGRVRPLYDWEEIKDLDTIIDCVSADEIIKRGGLKKILGLEEKGKKPVEK